MNVTIFTATNSMTLYLECLLDDPSVYDSLEVNK